MFIYVSDLHTSRQLKLIKTSWTVRGVSIESKTDVSGTIIRGIIWFLDDERTKLAELFDDSELKRLIALRSTCVAVFTRARQWNLTARVHCISWGPLLCCYLSIYAYVSQMTFLLPALPLKFSKHYSYLQCLLHSPPLSFSLILFY